MHAIQGKTTYIVRECLHIIHEASIADFTKSATIDELQSISFVFPLTLSPQPLETFDGWQVSLDFN